MACAGFAVVGVTSTMLTGCASIHIVKTHIEAGIIRVPLSEFTGKDKILVRSIELAEDILVLKHIEVGIHPTYSAIYLQCTHQEHEVSVGDKKLTCSRHGSQFDFNGNVLKAPAKKPLRRFKVTVSENQLEITI